MEVGYGPGGNLLEINKHYPKLLKGVDISEKMVQLATANLPPSIEVLKSTAESIPLESKSFDIVLTVTVLQHNTNQEMFSSLINEIARVSASKIILFERVEPFGLGNRSEGEPLSNFSIAFQKTLLPVSSMLDKFQNLKSDLTMLEFVRD